MSRKGLAWVFFVFGLTVLVELPAGWLLKAMPWTVQGVAGSVWQGQAARIGAVGPLAWHVRPWSVHLEAGYQAQRWRFEVTGWPWDWQAKVTPLGAVTSVASAYSLSGEWQGRLQVRGAGLSCVTSEGALRANQLALAAPWSLPLGRAEVRIECRDGGRILAQLALPEQHQLTLRAGVQTGQLEGRVGQGAAVYPLLVSAQWLAPGTEQVSRTFKW